MLKLELPGTDLSVTRFSFGTASLFKSGTRLRRQRLLAEAVQQGFSHFDTAPYYGFGTAERDLKPVLKANPEVTVATKVGIYSPGGEAQSDTAVFLRKAAGRLFPAISRPAVDWNVKRARDALTASLRRLGRDRVDLYLLHEPELGLLDCDEWLRWLESERDRVARFGVALDSRRLKELVKAPVSLISIVQTMDSNEDREANVLLDQGRPLQITYGYVSAARRRGPVDVPRVLAAALERNQTGSVIVSTGKIDRLRQYARICEAMERNLGPSNLVKR